MISPVAEDKRGRVDELDGLRGLLALWVLISHIFCWCGWIEARIPSRLQDLWSGFILGVPPVQTFIILSGFAISFLLHGRSNPTYFEFIKGRFFRLYPVYIVCLFFGIITSALVPAIISSASWHTAYFDWCQARYVDERAHMAGQIAAHLTLLNGLVPHRFLPSASGAFLPPAWSITLEWQYYLVAPFLALMVRSGRGILLLALVALLGIHASHFLQVGPSSFLPVQLPLFLVGIGSYHLYAWFREKASGPSPVFTIPIAAVLIVAVCTSGYTLALIMWALAFGCIFVRGDDLFSRGLSRLRRLLLFPSLQSLGKISYPLYLVHWPVLLSVLYLLLHVHPRLSSSGVMLALFLIGLPLSLLMAALLHQFIELPGMALGKSLAARRKAMRVETVQAG